MSHEGQETWSGLRAWGQTLTATNEKEKERKAKGGGEGEREGGGSAKKQKRTERGGRSGWQWGSVCLRSPEVQSKGHPRQATVTGQRDSKDMEAKLNLH